MKIVVIDGQGGRIGSLVTARLRKEQLPNCELYAIGTNATATAAMLKAGADFGATGENPVSSTNKNQVKSPAARRYSLPSSALQAAAV